MNNKVALNIVVWICLEIPFTLFFDINKKMIEKNDINLKLFFFINVYKSIMSDDGGDEPDIAEFTSDIENLNKEKHIVPKNKRKSTPRCSKFEFSNLISARLTQIYNDPNGIDNLLVLTDEEKDSVPIILQIELKN